MATNNSINNSLSGQTGSGNFTGSSGSSFSGNVNFSSTTEFLLPISSSPTLSNTGEIAINTNISGYPGMLQYYSGTEILTSLGILESDLSATDTYAVKYNSASSKLIMAAQSNPGTTGKLQQYIVQTSSSADSTTSTSLVNTSITASITPTNASSIILIACSGLSNVTANGSSSTDDINGVFEIRRTTGTPSTIMSYSLGKDLQDVSSSIGYPYYSQLCISGYETAGSTSTHTYIVRHSVATSAVISYIQGDISPSMMILMELLP